MIVLGSWALAKTYHYSDEKPVIISFKKKALNSIHKLLYDLTAQLADHVADLVRVLIQLFASFLLAIAWVSLPNSKNLKVPWCSRGSQSQPHRYSGLSPLPCYLGDCQTAEGWPWDRNLIGFCNMPNSRRIWGLLKLKYYRSGGQLYPQRRLFTFSRNGNWHALTRSFVEDFLES